MKPSSSTFGSEVWVHDSIVQTNFGRNNSYSSFVAQVKDPARMGLAVAALKELQTVKFAIVPEKEYYAKLTATNDLFRNAVRFVAAAMAIGGILGVMITMFAAVSQRTRDIGVLRLLGYARWQILASFLLESLAIGLIGGLLGVGVGWFCDGITATSILSGAQGGGKSVVLRLTVDREVIGTGLVFALVMSALGGILPAVNATRLRPLESLR
jgi:ABC-type antimicrobial peptide transport system permease subunit